LGLIPRINPGACTIKKFLVRSQEPGEKRKKEEGRRKEAEEVFLQI